jgi:hypothetical protein
VIQERGGVSAGLKSEVNYSRDGHGQRKREVIAAVAQACEKALVEMNQEKEKGKNEARNVI